MQNDSHSFSSSSPLLNIGLGSNTAPVLVDQDFERFTPLLAVQHLAPVTVSIKTKVANTCTPYPLLATASSRDGFVVSCSTPTDKHQQQLIANNGAVAGTLSTFFNPATFAVSVANRPSESQLMSNSSSNKTTTSTFERIASESLASERVSRNQFARLRGKSSQEELSEDSGYAESKQSACSDELDCTSLPAVRHDDSDATEDHLHERGLKIAPIFMNRERHSQNTCNEHGGDTEIRGGGGGGVGEQHQHPRARDGCGGMTSIDDDCDEVDAMEVSINTRENKRTQQHQQRRRNIPFGIKKKLKLGGCQRIASRSLPNIFLNQTAGDGEANSSADYCTATSSSETGTPKGDLGVVVIAVASGSDREHLSDEFLKVNSFPDGLNYLLSGVSGSYSDDGHEDGEEDSDGGECNRDFDECQFFSNDYYFLHDHGDDNDFFHYDTDVFGGTIASKNLDLNQFVTSNNSAARPFQSTPEPHVLQQQSRAGILSASYSNLTALDYSESPTRLFSNKMDRKGAPLARRDLR